MDLIRSISWLSVSHLRLVRDDDSYVDRLSHRYTVALCVLFAVIVSTKQYAGDPIDCWVPAQFKNSYEQYADSYCWITGTWHVPMDKELPLSESERRDNKIKYYQWVPFLLLLQAILCYLPRVIWRTMSVRSGIDIVNLLDACIKYENVDRYNDREKIMSYIIRNIERYIYDRKTHEAYMYLDEETMRRKKKQIFTKLRIIISSLVSCNGQYCNCYLIFLYLFVKTLWLVNSISQLFLLNSFIGNDYYIFGVHILQMLYYGTEWQELKHFPRVTYCDFKIREIGNPHHWSVQCVLPINLFNEVIYIFMWFWLCFLGIFTIIDYLKWCCYFMFKINKKTFLRKHLFLNENYSKYKVYIEQQMQQAPNQPPKRRQFQYEVGLFNKFLYSYLNSDILFVLRLLTINSSDLIVSEIVNELWSNFNLFELNQNQNALLRGTVVPPPSSNAPQLSEIKKIKKLKHHDSGSYSSSRSSLNDLYQRNGVTDGIDKNLVIVDDDNENDQLAGNDYTRSKIKRKLSLTTPTIRIDE